MEWPDHERVSMDWEESEMEESDKN